MVVTLNAARPATGPNAHLPSSVPSFGSVDGFIGAMESRVRQEPVDLYPRDGTLAVARLEQKIAGLAGTNAHMTIAYSSGMSALIRLVESSSPTKGTVVMHAIDEYSRTRRFLSDDLPKRGVKSVRVNTGSIDEVSLSIAKHAPDIIVFETVANGPNVPVLDIGKLFEIDALRQKNPLIILDNTLPTPTLVPIEGLLRPGFNLAVIESGMKAYSTNMELLGIVYASDPELLKRLREDRITSGAMPSFYQVEALSSIVSQSLEDFDRRNRSACGNTLALAAACQEAEGDGRVFRVSHPNLATHANKRLADATAEQGATPLFYIQCTGNADQFAIARALEQSSYIRSECELGQSFGFPKTRIFPDLIYPSVRISGGSGHADVHRLADEFKHALILLRRSV